MPTGSSSSPSFRPELGARPVRSQLVHALVDLDREYLAASPGEPWESWYARGLRARFSS